MIEIDLLPNQKRQKKLIPYERLFKGSLVFIVLGSLVILHLFLHTINCVGTIRLNRLQKSWESLSDKKAGLDQLNAELTKINQKVPLIEQLISNRVLWSEKLSRINDLIIPGIWLNEIILERENVKIAQQQSTKYLVIRGSAASRTKEAPALIGRFMQNLKDDSSFSADFAEIELGPIKKRQIRETEIMDFILICLFKEEQAKTLVK